MESDYRVHLDIFEGPLDLLLYLIRRDEIDIHDISLEHITTQYLSFLGTFKLLNIELASEFIVMAANLLYIKSRALLPRHVQPPEDDADDDDPRWELIRQLIEYKKFKDAAEFLRGREDAQERVFMGIPEESPISDVDSALPSSVGIFDLIRAFQKVLNRFQEPEEFGEIFDDSITISGQIDFLLSRISPGSRLGLQEIFQHASNKTEVVVTFVAILELIRLKEFRVWQEHAFSEIAIERDARLTETVE